VGKVREAAERQKRMNDLRQVGIAFQNYHEANRTFPPDEATFVKWAQTNAPEVVPIVQSGQYTILYGAVTIPALVAGDGTSNTVIGYDNFPLGGNRAVLTADGMAQPMTEAEFAAKPRLKARK
jgi:hypothetical protein